MIKSILFIIAMTIASWAQAGYIALTQDDVTARIELSFALEAGGTLTYTQQASGPSFSTPHVSRDISYYTTDDEGTAQAAASLDRYIYYFDLFTETEQYGDYFVHSGNEILPEIVASEGGSPLVDVLAQVNLAWRFRVMDDPVSFHALIMAENSLDQDAYLRLTDLTHHQVVLELLGGWENEDEVMLMPGTRYALEAQSLEFNGDDDIETEVYYWFDSDTEIVNVDEPRTLPLLLIGGLLLLAARRLTVNNRRLGMPQARPGNSTSSRG